MSRTTTDILDDIDWLLSEIKPGRQRNQEHNDALLALNISPATCNNIIIDQLNNMRDTLSQ